MKRSALSALVALLLTGSSAAEMYRCEDSEGKLRFADSPQACGVAVPHLLERRLERIGSAPPAAAALPQPAAADLAALLLSEAEAGAGWEVVREAAVDPARDPDLVDWGVKAHRALHYTRDVGGAVEVCSIELWSFETLAQAAAAGTGFSYPGWRITREGEILVMVRGLRRPRHAAPEHGVFAACEVLGRRVHERVAKRVASP